MKKLFFLFSLILFAATTTDLYGQPFPDSLSCENININGPGPLVDRGSTYTITASSGVGLTAYYWEVSSGLAIVSGQFTNQLEVMVIGQGLQTVCLNAFRDCEVVECCISFRVRNCDTGGGGGGLPQCCTADDYTLLFGAEWDCVPADYRNQEYFKVKLIDNCDTLPVAFTIWNISDGGFWTANNQPDITINGGASGSLWYWPGACGDFPFTVTVTIYYVDDNCPPVTVSAVNDGIPCCEGDPFFRNAPTSKDGFGLRPYSIQPNPAGASVSIQGWDEQKPLRAQLYDLNGQLIQSEVLQQNTLSLNQVPSGTYLFQLLDEQGQILLSEKLIHHAE